MEDAIYRALLDECAQELGVTIADIDKSPQRAIMREAVAKVATEKLSAALARALPIPRPMNAQSVAMLNHLNSA